MSLGVIFDPLLSWPVWWGLAALSGFAVGLGFFRGLAGAWLRAMAAALVLAVLAGPVLQQEEREALSDIVFVVTDRSASQKLGRRVEQTDQTEADVLQKLRARANTDVRQIVVGDGTGDAGTQVMSAIARALAEEPRSRVAGALVISDGLVHDLEATPEMPAPLHLLKTGERADWDRRLRVENAPAFAIIGEPVELTLRIENEGAAPEADSFTQLSISIGAEEPIKFDVPIGRDISVPVSLPHGGRNVIKFDIPEGEGELTGRNNSYLLEINGVRDRLRVLLVSGEPHAGGRTWRNLLKSDSSVDLVHFTILRPPEKQDGVPVGELSLIAFPTRELFIDKIKDFDLIIFDRYKRRGILPAAYLDNVRDYVETGGAVLIAAGPDFASADSIYRSPLGQIVPASPTARVIEQAYRPTVTETGGRHPVTRALDDGNWGRWMRQIELEDVRGDVLMEGFEGRPLLVLDRVGEGRVALLASDHAWLWARGYEGGGPQLELLRRLSHWMMKEPELEEEALSAEAIEGGLRIRRRSLSDAPDSVTVTRPSGETAKVMLQEVSPGVFEADIGADDAGLYRLEDNELASVVGLGPASPREFVTTIASADVLAPQIALRQGGAISIEDGFPSFRNVREGRNAAGARWLGLTPRGAYETIGLKQYPLMPPWGALMIFATFIIGGWLREGRRR
ncbi:hypothetical protein [Lentibacter sp. XHP0401]|uniref:hypothetical protein n=1 Tax=Lentibacter sp. XHP0401 TaxID=2984334 RepID=UPI0021E95444|nr:hypothetical protein [Lentibacter sp. XHP0401]MCV2892423.1 hypothetical protein [Lentibacter sp. XHP0401]